MVRGIYTGASSMAAQQHRMDALANNLANVDTDGYKRDQAVFKAFPELLIRRLRDDSVYRLPPSGNHPILGSVDAAPVVGRLGTGVELNEIYTDFTDGELQQTENPFDLALVGEGFFVVDTPYGERFTRNGSFILGPEGLLVTKEGYPVLGENGPISLKENNFVIDESGVVYQNAAFADDPNRLVTMTENTWDETEQIDRLQLVSFRELRYLRKQGSSLWIDTEDSGDARRLVGDDRPTVLQGYLEGSNVNPVREMVELIEVNRSYEASQKVVQSQDQATDQLLNRALRV